VISEKENVDVAITNLKTAMSRTEKTVTIFIENRDFLNE
jgi:hypothetical protein